MADEVAEEFCWAAQVPGKEGYVSISVDPLDADTLRDWSRDKLYVTKVTRKEAVAGFKLYAANKKSKREPKQETLL